MQWPDRSLYHALLNTATGEETVIHMMLSFKGALEQQTIRYQGTA